MLWLPMKPQMNSQEEKLTEKKDELTVLVVVEEELRLVSLVNI